MKFRYIIETVNKNGLKETLVEEITKPEFLIGRGSACDLRLIGKLVSLTHAQITHPNDGLVISDQDSLSGILVNNSLVSKETLKSGDRVKIGEFQFTVFKDGEGWGFLEKRAQKEASGDAEKLIELDTKKLQFRTYLPSFTITSLLLALIIAVLFLALPGTGVNTYSWNSGPISNPHKMIEDDCSQCHTTPFVQVEDQACIACHQMSDHAKNIHEVSEKHPEHNFRCAQCHMEHNGDEGLIAEESKLCSGCHAQLNTLLPGAERLNVKDLETHPEFRVSVRDYGADWSGTAFKRLVLGDAELKDPTPIKLNHKIHLAPNIRGENGPETLQCNDCHELDKDLMTMKPIMFEAHCESCHTLEFDGRLPGKEVPHGEPDVVYNFLYAEYAKLFLQTQGQAPEAAQSQRKRPGGRTYQAEAVEFSQTSVESQSRSVEESLFTQTACYLCHMVNERAIDGDEVLAEGKSRYQVVKPEIPSTWMPDARFDHGAHQAVSCESCHGGARTSADTAEVLLPGAENCRQCHFDGDKRGFVASPCVTCHSFHEPLVIDEKRKREIEKILLSFNFPSASFSKLH